MLGQSVPVAGRYATEIEILLYMKGAMSPQDLHNAPVPFVEEILTRMEKDRYWANKKAALDRHGKR